MQRSDDPPPCLRKPPGEIRRVEVSLQVEELETLGRKPFQEARALALVSRELPAIGDPAHGQDRGSINEARQPARCRPLRLREEVRAQLQQVEMPAVSLCEVEVLGDRATGQAQADAGGCAQKSLL